MADAFTRQLRHTWLYASVLVVSMLIVFTPITYRMVRPGAVYTDYVNHLRWAAELQESIGNLHLGEETPWYRLSHPAYELTVILVRAVVGGSYAGAGVLASVAALCLTALVLFHWMAPALEARKLSLWWAVGTAMLLSLVEPVLLLALWDHDLQRYDGGLGYQNPANIMLRPFAMIQFIYGFRSLGNVQSGWRQVTIAAVVAIIAALSRPSMAICMLPAMGILAAYSLLVKRGLDWRMITWGIVLPTVVVLVLQYLLTYGSEPDSTIAFAPLLVVGQYTVVDAAKSILTVLFPLLLIVLEPGARKDIRLQLAWLMYAIGIFYGYFLAELGPRLHDGNFFGSAGIAWLMLFCTSTIVMVERTKIPRRRSVALLAVWALHAGSGIIYYLRVLTTGTWR